MTEELCHAVIVGAICLTIGWLGFNMSQCTINRDNMQAKFPHKYTATATQQMTAQTGPQQGE